MRRLRRTDLAFVAGHGWYSEDGKLQGLLEVLGVPYTGSGVLASAIAMHKPSANSLLRQAGLRVPSWRQVDLAAVPDLEAKRLVHDLGLPVFVKPVSGGGSIGAGIARDRIELAARIQTVGAQTPMTAYMAAEYVDGADLSVGLIELHGELVTLPILAVEHDGEFYDYTIKHNVALRRESCPADLPPEVSELVGAMAKQAFAVLHCHGVARVDFVIDDRRRPWLLEVNTAPGLSEQGNLATMARAAGLSYTEMIEAVALTAFSKRGYRL